MLQGEHSAILSIFIKLPFVIKIFVLSTFEWLLKTGFTAHTNTINMELSILFFNGLLVKSVQNVYIFLSISALRVISAGSSLFAFTTNQKEKG